MLERINFYTFTKLRRTLGIEESEHWISELILCIQTLWTAYDVQQIILAYELIYLWDLLLLLKSSSWFFVALIKFICVLLASLTHILESMFLNLCMYIDREYILFVIK